MPVKSSGRGMSPIEGEGLFFQHDPIVDGRKALRSCLIPAGIVPVAVGVEEKW
jgi:hypothetical protein